MRDNNLSYYVRLMCKEDIAQVTEIDREAFPTQWPPGNYRHELDNRLAHYIVACEERQTAEEPKVETSSPRDIGLASWVRQLFSRNFFNSKPLPSGGEYILGFAGFWLMAGEAHIVNIAVREKYRRQGMGERLLISLIDMATQLNAYTITLEVRVFNTAAQSLYYKYGFAQTGLRRGYYTDNKEDGVIMSAENMTSASFQARLQQLKEAYSRRWGIARCEVVR